MGTFIDKGKAREIGLKVTGEMPVMGSSGKQMSLQISGGNTINVGGVEFANTDMAMNDNSNSTGAGLLVSKKEMN